MKCGTCNRPLHLAEDKDGVCLSCQYATMDSFSFKWWLGGVYNYRVRSKIKVEPQRLPMVGQTVRQ